MVGLVVSRGRDALAPGEGYGKPNFACELTGLAAWLGAITALLGAVIAIAQLIPGDEPEATLQRVVDFIAQFSRK